MNARRAVVVVADLMFQSRIALHARDGGWHCDVTESGAAALDALESPAALVIIDLHLPGVDLGALVPAAKGAPVVAFGRHTEPATLRAARQAGCTRALARSEFVEALPGLFAIPSALSASQEAQA